MAFDVVIRAGRVLDPGQGIDGPLDIGIRDGRIAALGERLDHAGASRVIDAVAPGRVVVPGLIDVHAHVARGAITPGVGMEGCDPDEIGVRSGVTTVVDAGSVGVANLAAFPAYIQPNARTRVLCYLNLGSHAHSMPSLLDVHDLSDVDAGAIAKGVAANPGVVEGIKLRLVGPVVESHGEDLVTLARKVARQHGVPLMVHIGDRGATRRGDADPRRFAEVTAFLLSNLDAGDILTHLCTPNVGGASDDDLLRAARARGVVLDAALGRGNFGFATARRQREAGLPPDTISTDLTALGRDFHSLVECMAKFMAVGYTLPEVVRMTTSAAAAALGLADHIGAIAPGREADITILDVVAGDFRFEDTDGVEFTGGWGIAPVHAVRAGELFAPHWGPHPWGWLPSREPA
ncbi:amidohydrolase family protein [Phytohabitans sp. ZYX-F-186]|uniref:Amidohydrolase family protein n=1 Tax=Phytohabitans maris TaxID=3071409 RepID=A0ABU0ZSX9_9ACTN|nr:amidohydrolase family protein [Phytohabitans sp. ZYX-F-186]MDQ7910143.1 amidohydrolase family protein [Phytohabitans sp. ZYX-F-186]